jgi:hypothetical protein
MGLWAGMDALDASNLALCSRGLSQKWSSVRGAMSIFQVRSHERHRRRSISRVHLLHGGVLVPADTSRNAERPFKEVEQAQVDYVRIVDIHLQFRYLACG